MPLTACPGRDELTSYLLGKLDEGRIEVIGEHLRRCAACRTIEAQLEGVADELVNGLRQGPAAPAYLVEPAWEALRVRLGQLGEAAGQSPGTVSDKETGPVDQPHPFQAVGRYRILCRLGHGGMGEVYKAFDPQLNRAVAVKLPRFNAARPNHGAAVERFLREMRAAAQVRHPHVCPVYDAGEQEGAPYAVMAFLEGGSLLDLLRKETLPVPRAVELARKAALGLQAIHDGGIVHRDVKPSNILLDAAGEPLVADFGLARQAQDAEHLTSDGVVVGTPAYMAPEQAMSREEEIGPATDVYSLGVVLYQMLTGKVPFDGEGLQVLIRAAEENPTPPSNMRPDVDIALERIVSRAMARRASDRYPTARAFAEALEAWRPTPKQEATPPRKRRGLLVAVAAGLVLISAGWVAAQIVIRLRDKDGKVTEIRPPEGTKVEVEVDGKKILEPEKPATVTIKPMPLPKLEGGAPLTPAALVSRPAKLAGVQNWTIETRQPRGLQHQVAYSPDGKWLAISDHVGSIRLLSTDSGKLHHVFVQATEANLDYDSLQSIAWSPDSKFLAGSRGTESIRIWDVEGGRLIRTMPASRDSCVTWSMDGRFLAYLAKDGGILVWDVRGEKMRRHLVVSGMIPRCLSLSVDGKYLAVAGRNAPCLVWEIDSEKPPAKMSLGVMKAVAYSPDGSCLACGNEAKIELRSVDGRDVKREISGRCFTLAWSADSKTLLTGIEDTGKSGWVTYDGTTGMLLTDARKLIRWGFVATVSMAPDGRTVATMAIEERSVQLWFPDGEVKRVIHCFRGNDGSHYGGGLAWSPDGTRIFITGSDPTVRMADTGEVELRLPDLEHMWSGNPWCHGRRTLALTGGSGVRLVDAANGKELERFGNSNPGLFAVASSPDGTWLATGHLECARLWNLSIKKNVHVLSGG